jgi:hypothetical protein
VLVVASGTDREDVIGRVNYRGVGIPAVEQLAVSLIPVQPIHKPRYPLDAYVVSVCSATERGVDIRLTGTGEYVDRARVQREDEIAY